jgi:hypothetical protein
MKIAFFKRSDNDPSTLILPKQPGKCQYRNYTELEKQFIRDHYESLTTTEIAQALGRPKSGIQTYAWRVLKIRKSPQAFAKSVSKGQQARQDIDLYSEQERQFMRDNWQTMTNAEIASALGRTFASVKKYGNNELGLKRTHETLSRISQRPNAGQFQKGQLPPNTIYGDEQTIRIRHSNKGPDYKYIRTGFRKWQEYHRWLWIQHNGPIPKGFIVAFENGDTMDVRIDNLKLITLKENVLRNSGSINLSDGFVVNTLARLNPELKQEIRSNHPELIEVKRAHILLNRALKSDNHAEIIGNTPGGSSTDNEG